MFKIKHILSLILIITVLFLTISCTDLSDEKDIASDEVRRSFPDQEFENAHLTHTNNGEVTFVLNSPIINRYDKEKRAELKGGIKVDFFKEGKTSSWLTAEEGEILKDGHEMLARGNVIVETDSGLVVKTPELTWSDRDNLIRSDTIVTIITQWDTLKGTGLIASQDLKYRKILNPVGVSRRKIERKEKSKTDSLDSTTNQVPDEY